MSGDACILDVCQGAKTNGCRNALSISSRFVAGLQAMVGCAPCPEAYSALGRPLLHHERFRLALSACPNGCSRPHTADLGIIAFSETEVLRRLCSGCGACVCKCPDDAIALAGNVAAIDSQRCLGCGRCVLACKNKALSPGAVRYRIVLGGRLGRHPRLGRELQKRLDSASVVSLAGRCLEVYQQRMLPGRRFSDILFPQNFPGFPAWVFS